MPVISHWGGGGPHGSHVTDLLYGCFSIVFFFTPMSCHTFTRQEAMQ